VALSKLERAIANLLPYIILYLRRHLIKYIKAPLGAPLLSMLQRVLGSAYDNAQFAHIAHFQT
jgi:hypothetical protein